MAGQKGHHLHSQKGTEHVCCHANSAEGAAPLSNHSDVHSPDVAFAALFSCGGGFGGVAALSAIILIIPGGMNIIDVCMMMCFLHGAPGRMYGFLFVNYLHIACRYKQHSGTPTALPAGSWTKGDLIDALAGSIVEEFISSMVLAGPYGSAEL